MRSAGISLARTLYTFPLTILLTGELGVGKTTFMQGFAEGLGILDVITSPTFALEQRYMFPWKGEELECMHLDFYRLPQDEVEGVLSSTETCTGIRCIEWADRLPCSWTDSHIDIHINDSCSKERKVTVRFSDVLFPTREQVDAWRAEVLLPDHIQKHCDKVGELAERIGRYLAQQGQCVRPLLLRRAGELHDLLRFVDFRPGASPQDMEYTDAMRSCWNTWQKKYPGMHHEAAAAAFLHGHGFAALGDIVALHGYDGFSQEEKPMTEQGVLYYADKRLKFDEVVPLDERFADLHVRYPDFMASEKGKIMCEMARDLEKNLFPKGVPF